MTAAFGPQESVAAGGPAVAISLIYKRRQQALSAKSGGTSFAPEVLVDEPAGSSDKAATKHRVAISVALPTGRRVSIDAIASANLATAILRELQ